METDAEVHRAHPVHHEENCCHEENDEKTKSTIRRKEKKQSGWGPEYLFVLGARWQEVEIIASGKDAVMKAQGRKDGREEGRRRRRRRRTRRRRREVKKVLRSAGRNEDTRRRKGGRGAKISEEKKSQGKEGRMKDMRHEKREKTMSRNTSQSGSITRLPQRNTTHFHHAMHEFTWHIKSQRPISGCNRLVHSYRHHFGTSRAPTFPLFREFDSLSVCLLFLDRGSRLSSSTDHPNSVARVESSSKSCSRLNVRGVWCFGSVAKKWLARVSTRLFWGCQNLIRFSGILPTIRLLGSFSCPAILPTTFSTHLLLPSTFSTHLLLPSTFWGVWVLEPMPPCFFRHSFGKNEQFLLPLRTFFAAFMPRALSIFDQCFHSHKTLQISFHLLCGTGWAHCSWELSRPDDGVCLHPECAFHPVDDHLDLFFVDIAFFRMVNYSHSWSRLLLSRTREASVALECDTEMNIEGWPVKAVSEAVRNRPMPHSSLFKAVPECMRSISSPPPEGPQPATWPGPRVGPPAEVNEMDEQRREVAPENRSRATRPLQGSAMEVGGARFLPEFDAVYAWTPRDIVIIERMIANLARVPLSRRKGRWRRIYKVR